MRFSSGFAGEVPNGTRRNLKKKGYMPNQEHPEPSRKEKIKIGSEAMDEQAVYSDKQEIRELLKLYEAERFLIGIYPSF